MSKEKSKTTGNFFSFRGMRIERRLKKAFNIVTIISAVASLVGLIAIVVVTSNFKNAMNNYALPQGDIALFMNEYAECRSNMRGIIGYEDQDLIDSLIQKHAVRKEATYERLAAIEKTMVTPEGKAAYNEIEKALEAYFEKEAEVIKIGATTDQALSSKAQQIAIDEVAPLYEELDAVTLHLMDVNIEKEHEMEQVCNVLQYGAMALMVILTIAIILISRRVSIVIANGISKPLNELEERLESFEKGDISSPFPDYHDDDEVGDMVAVVSATTSKLQKIFEDVEYFNQNDFIKNLEGISGLHSMYFRLICGYQSIDKFIPSEAEEIDDKFEIIKTLLQKNSSFSGFELYLLNKNFLEEIYSKIGFLDIGFVSLYLKSLLIGALSSLIYGEVKYGLTDEEVKLINLIKKNPKIKRIEFVDYGFCDKSVYNYCVKICKKIGIIDSKNKGTGLKMLKNIIKDGIFDYLADKK